MELRQEKQVYEIPHRLTYYECDDTGHPTMGMLLSMMTMVSDAHSIALAWTRPPSSGRVVPG